MELWIIILLQSALSLAGFALLWRRQQAMGQELHRTKSALAALEVREASTRKHARAAAGGATVVTYPAKIEPPSTRAQRLWAARRAPPSAAAPRPLPREAMLAAFAALPAIAIPLGAELAFAATAGLLISAGLLALSLQGAWRQSSWLAAAALAGWAGAAAFATEVSAYLAAFMAFAGVLGLAWEVRWRAFGAGAFAAGAIAAVALFQSAQTTALSAVGLCFVLMVAAAALAGASHRRLETLLLGAFIAAIAGLYVFSGQEAAAIWFTPAAALTGAFFFSIAALRAPELGERGALIASVGVIAPLAAICALHDARHALTDPVSMGLAALAVAAAFAGALTHAIARHGLPALKLTAWVLAGGAFAALAIAISVALPAPLAAPAFALVGMGLALLNARLPHAVLTTLAPLSFGASALYGIAAAAMLLTEAPGWPLWALALLAFGAPAALAGATAQIARASAPKLAAIADSASVLFAAAALSLLARILFSDSAPLLHPLGVLEASTHIAIWLALAFAAALLPQQSGRTFALQALVLAALAASAVSLALSIGAYSTAQGEVTLALLAPGALFGAHWALWRHRGAHVLTHATFAAATLSVAAMIAFFTVDMRGLDWVAAIACAGLAALAVAANFARGVSARAKPA